jgi:hypothetical protein
MMDNGDTEPGRVGDDLAAFAADHAARNNGIGHWRNPCSLAWDDAGAANTQRPDAAPATSRSC